MALLAAILGIALVAGIIALVWALMERARLAARLALAQEEAVTLRAAGDERLREVGDLRAEAAALRERLQSEARARDEYRTELERRLAEAQRTFREAIDASAGKALGQTSEELRKWAKATFEAEQAAARQAIDAKVKPIDDTLKETRKKLQDIESERIAAYERLATQLRQAGEASAALHKETSNLVAALRKPQVRGRYGEVQLRRVAELAGMRDYCDFDEQSSTNAGDGARLRPDMIVRLPNERCVVVDAKTNIEAYLDAIDSSDPAEAERHLDRFARHVSDQAAALSKKGYWTEFDGAADFVVMFIPGDQFIDAALQRRPDLMDLAWQQRIILASPSTLIGLLRAVHVGWREKRLSDQANELFQLGRELHKRAAVAFEHLDSLGDAIRKSADRYNAVVGSVERQLTPTLRRFEDAGAKSEKELSTLPPIETAIREPRSLPTGST